MPTIESKLEKVRKMVDELKSFNHMLANQLTPISILLEARKLAAADLSESDYLTMESAAGSAATVQNQSRLTLYRLERELAAALKQLEIQKQQQQRSA